MCFLVFFILCRMKAATFSFFALKIVPRHNIPIPPRQYVNLKLKIRQKGRLHNQSYLEELGNTSVPVFV